MATTPTMLSARRDELAATGSPVSAFSPASGFRPACWPPSQEGALEYEALRAPHWCSPSRNPAEETLLRWQVQVGSLDSLERMDGPLSMPSPPRDKHEVGLHRLARPDARDSADDDGSDFPVQGALEQASVCTDDKVNRNSAEVTLSNFVHFLGKRMQEVHTELQTPRPFSGSVDDSEARHHDLDQTPAERNVSTPPRPAQPPDAKSTHESPATSAQGSRSKTPPTRLKQNSFFLSRVVTRADEELAAQPKPELANKDQKEQLDQNAVAEWWSNLFRLKPGAPSRQAILIRETHDTLAQMLIKKDERIDTLHTRNMELWRSFKAAEGEARTMVADLQAYRAEFAEEFNGWLKSRREMDTLHSQHARELLGMQKRLDDAHVTEVAELTRRLNEEKRLKEDAQGKAQELLGKIAALDDAKRSSSNSVANLQCDLVVKDAEIEKLRLILQQKETEIKLLASEHQAALTAKDVDHLHKVETQSQLHSAEIERANHRHQAELNSKIDEYRALLRSKDALLEERDQKNNDMLEAATSKFRMELDALMSQLKSKDSKTAELEVTKDKTIRDLRSTVKALEERLEKKEQDSSVQIALLRAEIERLKAELDQEQVKRRELAELEGTKDKTIRDLQSTVKALEERLEKKEQDSSAQIALLRAEIERLKAELDQEQVKRRELEAKLRLAEEAMRRAKLVGIGMRITETAPHRITEIVEGSAAHLSGAIEVGDYLLEVAQMSCNDYPIAEIRNFILGPVGSYLELKLDRRLQDDEGNANYHSNIFTVKVKRAEFVSPNHATSTARPASGSFKILNAGRATPRPASGSSSTPTELPEPGHSPFKSLHPQAAATKKERSPANEASDDASTSRKKRGSTDYVPGPFF